MDLQRNLRAPGGKNARRARRRPGPVGRVERPTPVGVGFHERSSLPFPDRRWTSGWAHRPRPGHRRAVTAEVRLDPCVGTFADAEPWTAGVIDHESPRDIPGSPGTLRNPGPGRGPGPTGAGARPAHRPAARPRRHRRGSPTSGPSPTCSPPSSRRTTRRTPRRSATCSRRTPRSRTRTARSRGAATPSSRASRGPSRKTAATHSPSTPTPCGSSGLMSPSRRAWRRSRPGRTPRPARTGTA